MAEGGGHGRHARMRPALLGGPSLSLFSLVSLVLPLRSVAEVAAGTETQEGSLVPYGANIVTGSEHSPEGTEAH